MKCKYTCELVSLKNTKYRYTYEEKDIFSLTQTVNSALVEGGESPINFVPVMDDMINSLKKTHKYMIREPKFAAFFEKVSISDVEFSKFEDEDEGFNAIKEIKNKTRKELEKVAKMVETAKLELAMESCDKDKATKKVTKAMEKFTELNNRLKELDAMESSDKKED